MTSGPDEFESVFCFVLEETSKEDGWDVHYKLLQGMARKQFVAPLSQELTEN